MIEGLKSGSLIRIVDVSGSIVGNYKAEGDIVRIPFDNFMSGVYFIQIQYDGKVKTEKILKK